MIKDNNKPIEPTEKQLEDCVRHERLHDKERFIQREINMECLNCGKSLKKEIMGRKIRIHLCEDCRGYYIDKISKEVLEDLDLKDKGEDNDKKER